VATPSIQPLSSKDDKSAAMPSYKGSSTSPLLRNAQNAARYFSAKSWCRSSAASGNNIRIDSTKDNPTTRRVSCRIGGVSPASSKACSIAMQIFA
jgi:hypothetical protein